MKKTLLFIAIVFTVVPVTLMISYDADAAYRSGGFRSSSSFSRSSFRSSSSGSKSLFKSSSRTKSTKAAAPKRATTTAKKTSFTQLKKTSPQKFKAKPAPVPQARNKYTNTSMYATTRGYNRSTYSTRRDAYYSNYNPPVYVYNTAPSFGMWDTLFLYHILSSNNAANMAYNYQNNADYQAWRRDADRLAQENADLKTQLAALDSQVSQMSGAIDENYVPDGVDADLMVSETFRQATKPILRFCVGGKSGTYNKVVNEVIAPNVTDFMVAPIPTKGSADILSKIASGDCDIGFVQGDSYWNYVEQNETTNMPFERLMSTYRESVHLACNQDAWDTDGLTELTEDNVVYMPDNSGAKETWINLLNEDSSIKASADFTTDYETAFRKASQDPKACALYVGNTGTSKLLKSVDRDARITGLELVEVIPSKAIFTTTDPSGKQVYTAGEIDDAVYPNLLRSGGCYGACAGNIPTLEVSADIIVSNDWKTKNGLQYDALQSQLFYVESNLKNYSS